MHAISFRLTFFLVLLGVVLLVGTFGFAATESLSLSDAAYFSIVTIATARYGDIHPVAHLGKLVAGLMIITGVGTLLGVIANATELLFTKREQSARIEKLNMVIGLFFNELENRMLALFSDPDPAFSTTSADLVVTTAWSRVDSQRISRRLKDYRYQEVIVGPKELAALRELLDRSTDLLVRFLENPALLEHESFTALLQTVFHLNEELSPRHRLEGLPATDIAHLSLDITRVYRLLVRQWLRYMEHLKNNYPYLFSLALRANPFERKASVIVQ